MKKSETLQIVNFRMTPSEITRMDRLAKKYGKTRSEYLRTNIILGVEEDEVFERCGLIRAALTVRNVVEWMSGSARKISEDIDIEKEIEA